MGARDVMSSPAVTVGPATTVKRAAQLLADNGFTALPVVDDDRLVGIVSEADVVRDRFPRDPRYLGLYREDSSGAELPRADRGRTVAEVMTTTVICLGPGTDVVDVVTTMLDDRLRSVPIVEGSRVVGVITRRDLVGLLARDDVAIAADVRHRLAGYGGPDRWTVSVHDGVVAIDDEYDDATDRHVAAVLAESVPGVTTAHVTSKQPSN